MTGDKLDHRTSAWSNPSEDLLGGTARLANAATQGYLPRFGDGKPRLLSANRLALPQGCGGYIGHPA